MLIIFQIIMNGSAIRGAMFDPWVGRIPWRREWQPTPVFLYMLTGWGELSSFCWGCLPGACPWLCEQSLWKEGRRKEWGIEGRMEWGPKGCCLGNRRLLYSFILLRAGSLI